MKRRSILILAIVAACVVVIAVVTVCEVRRGHRMQEALELALEQNRSGVPFTSDTIVLATDTTQLIPLHDVVAYYNAPFRRFLSRHSSFITRHSSLFTSPPLGEAGRGPQSLYALGCVYRDLHEAPIALLTWEDAIAAADTTSVDCDYHTLSAIHSQMAEMYDGLFLLSAEINNLKSSSYYSLLEGDTLYAIHDVRRIGSCYIMLNKLDSAEYFLCKAQELYYKYGYIQEGLLASTPLIGLYVEEGKLEEAKPLMDRYESEFEEFDENHELPPRRRLYFCYKGSYFERSGLLDSAEHYYRKALHPEMRNTSRDPIYAGLLRVFQRSSQTDSIAKYAQLYCAANDSSIAVTDRELTAQVAANYNYTRSQEEAISQRERAGKLTIALTISGAILFATFIIAGVITRRNHERKKRQNIEFARLHKELKTTQSECASQTRAFTQFEALHKTSMELLRQDINRLSTENKEDKRQLEESQRTLKAMSLEYEKNSLALREDIELKKQKIETLEHHISKYKEGEIASEFEDSLIVRHIRKLVEDRDKMLKRDLRKLREAGDMYFPILMDDLNNNKDITPRAIQVCLLLLICDRVEDIATLIGVKASRVTNLKGNISEALFGKKDSRSLLQKMATHYGTPIP